MCHRPDKKINSKTDKPAFSDEQHQWMNEALVEARLAAAAGDVPVGAIVVMGGKIIGRGRNLREAEHDPSAHAEIAALRQAGQAIKGWRLADAEMYVTLEPCPMCASALVLAKVKSLVYGLDDPKLGACGSLINLVQFPGFDHDVSVRGGLLAAESAKLLQDFFALRRSATY